MEEQTQNLGTLMHDAGLDELVSDLARKAVDVIVMSSAFLERYGLPENERVRLRVEEVDTVSCWLWATEGRKESADWSRAEAMAASEDASIFRCSLKDVGDGVELEFSAFWEPVPRGYSDMWFIRITGKAIRFFLVEADREISLKMVLLQGKE